MICVSRSDKFFTRSGRPFHAVGPEITKGQSLKIRLQTCGRFTLLRLSATWMLMSEMESGGVGLQAVIDRFRDEVFPL